MLALVVEFRIKPGHADAFAAAIVENARLSRETEPGCLQFDVCRDPGDEAVFYLYELYADDTAIQAHLASEHFLRMNEATGPWVESKTVRLLARIAP